MDLQEAIVFRLKEIMFQKGWTNYKLHKASKVGMTTIGMLFNHNKNVKIETLYKLILGLGIEFVEFFNVDYLKLENLND
ncbi:MAG: helix-turn-helix transcriptional regulator [Clostridia bacterium]|nr:helix-turn-helix transcriptional regulator [Clostridia bacterium]